MRSKLVNMDLALIIGIIYRVITVLGMIFNAVHVVFNLILMTTL